MLMAIRAAEAAMMLAEAQRPADEPRCLADRGFPEAMLEDTGGAYFKAGSGGRVAVIPVEGVLGFSSLALAMYGWLAVSTVTLGRRIEAAGNDPTVSRVVLDIHSPGGELAGMTDLAEIVKRVSAAKPVHAFVHDWAYSGGYWLASCCTEITCSPTGGTGSIGVIRSFYDVSKAFAEFGLRPVVLSDQHHKAFGMPGRAVGDLEEADEISRREWEIELGETRKHAERFFAEVSDRRGIARDTLAEWAGRCFTGDEQIEAGLVDRIETTAAFWERVLNSDGDSMSTQTPLQRALAAASLEEKQAARAALNAELPPEEEDEAADDAPEDEAAEDAEPDEAADETPEEEDEEETPASATRPATFEQLDGAVSAKVPGRDALIAQGLRDKLTVTAFQTRVQEHLVALSEGAAADPASAKLRRHAKAGEKPATPGGQAARTGGFATYDEAVEATAKAKGISRVEAAAEVNKAYPALRAAYRGRRGA